MDKLCALINDTFNGVCVDTGIIGLDKVFIVIHFVPEVTIVWQILVGLPTVSYYLENTNDTVKCTFIHNITLKDQMS